MSVRVCVCTNEALYSFCKNCLSQHFQFTECDRTLTKIREYFNQNIVTKATKTNLLNPTHINNKLALVLCSAQIIYYFLAFLNFSKQYRSILKRTYRRLVYSNILSLPPTPHVGRNDHFVFPVKSNILYAKHMESVMTTKENKNGWKLYEWTFVTILFRFS